MRVRHEVVLTNASMIVIDGIMAMFLDEQIKRFEARSILRHCLAMLQDVATQCPVIVLDGQATSNIHRQLKQTMRPYLNHQVRATWEDKKHRKLKFSGIDGHVTLDMNSKQTDEGIQRLQAFTSTDPIE